MCLATAYRNNDPDNIILEFVSRIEVNGENITLTDVMGDSVTVVGTVAMADLTGGVVKINCPQN